MPATEYQKALLQAARRAVAAEVTGRPCPAPGSRIAAQVPIGGVFVTLRVRGTLRGCMGTFSVHPEVLTTVGQVAALAVHDPRFDRRPLTLPELPDLVIEITLADFPRPTTDPLSLELGRHGVIVESGGKSGCFLPQVALEFRWSKEEFLRRCCRDKAKLPADAWKQPDTRVSLFTAERFAEQSDAEP